MVLKKHLPLFVWLLTLVTLAPAFGQKTAIWPWPWMVGEEYAYPFLPIGGWNTPGSFSPTSLAMGETYLTADNSTAGYLNPACLSHITAPQFSLSYRYTRNRYKTSPWGPLLDRPVQAGSQETAVFSRETDFLDSAGLVLPFTNWVLAANYSLFQEYDFPDIRGPYWGYPIPLAEPDFWYGYPQSVKQTGHMKGLNLAFSWRVTPAISLGASASYVFGDIDRVEELPDIYVIQTRKGPDGVVSGSDAYTFTIHSATSAKGFFFNLGFTWQLSSQLLLGLSLRPPFSLDVQTDIERVDPAGLRSFFSADNYFKQPLIAGGSILFHPLEPFRFTIDLSYWGWGAFSTDIDPGWFGSPDFKSVLKFNLGAEYVVRLPFDVIETLALRAGFIYDSQPYGYSPSIARDFVTFGFGLPAGPLDLQFAAKLGLSSGEKSRFHSDVLQVGAVYRF
jgi:long-subunit fatty acid transport protein